MEQLINNGSSTLDGGIDGSTDPLTFTVTDASLFPSVGNFTIKIESEILLVTAVSGNDFTANRAQEGTAIAAHSDTTPVDFCLTKGSVNRVLGEFMMIGDGSDRPGPTEEFRSYQHTDQPLIARVLSGAWKTFYGSNGPFTPTQSGDFSTWVNQSTYGYVTDATDSWLLGDLGGDSGDQPRMRLASMSGDAELIVAFLPYRDPQTDNLAGGIIVRESSSGKHYQFVFKSTDSEPATFAVYRYTNTTSFDATIISQPNVIMPDVKCMKVVHTAGTTTLDVYLSPDYINWRKAATFSYSGFFTPNQMGLFVNNISGPGSGLGDSFINILSAEFTP